jgi:hypothetical protein
MTIALVAPRILNWRFGGGKGFEFDRQKVGSDELCFPVKNDDGTYSVLSPNKDTWLSIQFDGSLGERPSDGEPGYWERFSRDGITLTELQKDGSSRPLVSFLCMGDLDSNTRITPANNGNDNAQAEQWIPSGRFFTNLSGTAVRYRGFTAFKLLNLFEKGTDIRPFLDAYKGYNLARIFLNTDPKDWKENAWDFPSESATLDFLEFMRASGFNVEITLVTDEDSRRIDQVKSLVNFLKTHKPINLLLEAVNEPYVAYDGQLYGKLDPNIFKNLLSGSGFPYTSGVYANLHKFYGNYFVDHSSRGEGWYGKGGHNLMEAYEGGGPNDKSEPALRMPCIEDEPIRPDQANYDLLGALGYAASCGLMGAGATVHTESGKLAALPSDSERQWIAAFLQGLNTFPVDAANGAYRRIVEPGQIKEARTYVVGNYSVRIKQNGLQHPESGWNPLDAHGICWGR